MGGFYCCGMYVGGGVVLGVFWGGMDWVNGIGVVFL